MEIKRLFDPGCSERDSGVGPHCPYRRIAEPPQSVPKPIHAHAAVAVEEREDLSVR